MMKPQRWSYMELLVSLLYRVGRLGRFGIGSDQREIRDN